jgi:acyl dehydratase
MHDAVKVQPPPFTPGEELGVSDWMTVTQEMINGFGVLTNDPDPIHMDAAVAAAGPFGRPTAFGFLTISLLTSLLRSAQGEAPGRADAPGGHGLNYGFDRLRLVAPVPAGSRIRGRFKALRRREDEKGRLLGTYECIVEIEDQDRPAMVAEWVTIWIPDAE